MEYCDKFCNLWGKYNLVSIFKHDLTIIIGNQTQLINSIRFYEKLFLSKSVLTLYYFIT